MKRLIRSGRNPLSQIVRRLGEADKNTKEFAVVIFLKANTVDAVPTNWIERTQKGLYCYWPKPDKNVTAKVKRREIPDKERWTRDSVRILKFTDTYAEAREKVKEAIVTSNLDSVEEEIIPRRIAPARYQDSDADIDQPVLKRKKKPTKDTTSTPQMPTMPSFQPSMDLFSAAESQNTPKACQRNHPKTPLKAIDACISDTLRYAPHRGTQLDVEDSEDIDEAEEGQMEDEDVVLDMTTDNNEMSQMLSPPSTSVQSSRSSVSATVEGETSSAKLAARHDETPKRPRFSKAKGKSSDVNNIELAKLTLLKQVHNTLSSTTNDKAEQAREHATLSQYQPGGVPFMGSQSTQGRYDRYTAVPMQVPHPPYQSQHSLQLQSQPAQQTQSQSLQPQPMSFIRMINEDE
ncbi:hypothetical protein ABVT39_026170 [Epinephelus coioides]